MTEMLDEHSDWEATGDGVRRRIAIDGEKLMLVEFRFMPGAVVASHSHPHEQVSYVVSGRLRYTVGEHTTEYKTGQSVHFPSNVQHSLVALEESHVVDAFSPPREDFRK